MKKKVLLALLSLVVLLSLSACQREAKAPPGAVKIGKDGGVVETDTARVVVAPGVVSEPIYVSVKDLPLDTPLPGPPLPPEVKLIAAAHFEQSHPFPEEWQNFFLPEVQLSLKNAVAPVEGSGYFTEICFWVPAEEDSPRVNGDWFCEGPHTIRSGDPTKKGSGWVATTIKGFGPRGVTFYLFQYPRDWARANCEAAGGRFNENAYGPFGTFFHKCDNIDTRYYDLSLGQVIYNPLAGQSRSLETEVVLLGDDYSLKTTTWNVGNTKSESYYKLFKDDEVEKVGGELKSVDPDILHLQEVFIESTYCAAHPNSKLCQDLDTPVIERILEAWKGADWRSKLDYVCMQYECTVIKKRTASGLTLEFLDKSDPMYTNYVTGVEGEDTGYLFAMLKVTYPGGKVEHIASFNEHSASPAPNFRNPADPNKAKVRAKQFEAQRRHIQELLRSSDSSNLAPNVRTLTMGGANDYRGPRPDGILKMGDFNVHLIPHQDGTPSERIPEADDLALLELIATTKRDKALDGYFSKDSTKDQAFSQQSPALLWRVGSDDYYTGYVLKINWLPMAPDIVASNHYVGTCGVVNDLAKSWSYGFDHNPVACDVKPVKTRTFTGAAVRGGVNLPYWGGGVGPSVRAGSLFPNKGGGLGPLYGPYTATFLDLGASFPVTFNPDGSFTVEVPEHILKAGLPLFVRFCVPQLGCKIVRLDPEEPNFTIPFEDDCDELRDQSAFLAPAVPYGISRVAASTT